MIADAAMAALCRDAYTGQPTFQVHGLQATLTTIDGFDVLAVRGTDSIIDWIRDLAWRPLRSKELGLIHRGFLFGAAFLHQSLKPSERPLILTGHSLGGAMALVVGGILATKGKPPIRIVTFGAPRVGRGKIVEVLKDVSITQYRNGNDPVTQLPFALLPMLRFQHAREITPIGVPMHNPMVCHSISVYAGILARLQERAP